MWALTLVGREARIRGRKVGGLRVRRGGVLELQGKTRRFGYDKQKPLFPVPNFRTIYYHDIFDPNELLLARVHSLLPTYHLMARFLDTRCQCSAQRAIPSVLHLAV